MVCGTVLGVGQHVAAPCGWGKKPEDKNDIRAIGRVAKTNI